MKKIKNFWPIVFLIFIFSCNTKVAPKISFRYDYSAVDAYFRLIDKLQSTRKISKNDWRNFLDIKGNRLYIEENNISNSFTNQLKTIIEDIYLSDEIKNTDMFHNIRRRYKNNNVEYRNHLKWLKENEIVLSDSIQKRALQFLPKNPIKKDRLISIYYQGLDHDGSANEKGIFISIMAAYANNKKRLGNYEAHELHHILRPSLIENLKIDKKDKPLILTLEAILNEGTANLVDKDVMLSESSDWWMKNMVNSYYIDEAPNTIKSLDSLIIEESKGNHQSLSTYNQILLNSVGHVPGYYLTHLIKENKMGYELIENINNPFKFFKLYNSIAKTKKQNATFSEETMAYLNQLELKYLKQ